MKKSDIQSMPQFFDRYINLAEDKELVESLKETLTLDQEFVAKLGYLGNKIYAPKNGL